MKHQHYYRQDETYKSVWASITLLSAAHSTPCTKTHPPQCLVAPDTAAIPDPRPLTPRTFTASPHYWNPVLCRVPVALGKDLFVLGKGFAEGHTRQRTHGKIYVGKGSLPSAEKTLGKD
jgi:hypothetical protein